MQGYYDGTMVHIATYNIVSLQWLIHSHTLNSNKKFKYCENQEHLYICQIVDILNTIKWKLPSIFVYNNLK